MQDIGAEVSRHTGEDIILSNEMFIDRLRTHTQTDVQMWRCHLSIEKSSVETYVLETYVQFLENLNDFCLGHSHYTHRDNV